MPNKQESIKYYFSSIHREAHNPQLLELCNIDVLKCTLYDDPASETSIESFEVPINGKKIVYLVGRYVSNSDPIRRGWYVMDNPPTLSGAKLEITNYNDRQAPMIKVMENRYSHSDKSYTSIGYTELEGEGRFVYYDWRLFSREKQDYSRYYLRR